MMNIQRFAAATGKVCKVKGTIKSLESDLTAVTTDGIVFDVKNYSNDRLLLVFKNTNASTAKDVTIKAPTKPGYAAAGADLELADVAAGGVAAAWVETAAYANTDGTILCKGESTDIKVVAVVW